MDIEPRDDKTPAPENGGSRPPDWRPYRPLLVWGLIAVLFLLLIGFQGADTWIQRPKKLTYNELVTQIQNGQVRKVMIEKKTGNLRGEFRATGVSATEPRKFVSNADPEVVSKNLLPLLAQHQNEINYEFEDPSRVGEVVLYILPMIVVGLFFYFLIFRQMRQGGGGVLSFGKSKAVRITRDKSKKTFDDVAGVEEAKQEVIEIIEFLRSPERFRRLGGRLPRGVLLIGQPGTGKTLLAKAIAGEADVPFFSISGSDFVEMFVGVGASRVRDLFEQAKESSPCIVFLDEIDAVGRRRINDIPGSGVESAQTLNAILVEMDGFTSDDKVIVIAATNRPDVLDPALLRPGRFDRQITVDLPDIKGREAILKVHARSIKMAEDVDLSVIARGTPTFSGAELENLVNEGALIAVMRGREAVDMECLEEARDKVRFGKEKRSRQMNEEDRRATAVHEAGHALLMRLLPHVTPLHKVTIIPRGRALGATMQLPEKDEYNMGRKRILGEITVRLGGRVAEELFMDDITNGAANDLEQATHLARAMVCEWGMSEALGLIYYSERDKERHGFFEGKEFSEATANKIDDEVHRIVDECYREARRVLEAHRAEEDLLVEALMEFETLTREEVDLLLEEKSLDGLRKRRAQTRAKAAAREDFETAPATGESGRPDAESEGRALPPGLSAT